MSTLVFCTHLAFLISYIVVSIGYYPCESKTIKIDAVCTVILNEEEKKWYVKKVESKKYI